MSDVKKIKVKAKIAKLQLEHMMVKNKKMKLLGRVEDKIRSMSGEVKKDETTSNVGY